VALTTLQKLMTVVKGDFAVSSGSPLPFGARVVRGGINFAVFSKYATEVTLVLFFGSDAESMLELPLDPDLNRTGEVWHIFVRGLDPGIRYCYRMDRVPNDAPLIHRFDRKFELLDPYAQAVVGRFAWGVPNRAESTGLKQRHCALIESQFDWELDRPLNIPLAESIIYELHVRGFTQHASSGVSKPGTFAGLTEKIPYLKSLGVTAVELMPIYDFEEDENPWINPLTGEKLFDYWGYNPISFFAPNTAYSSDMSDIGPVDEFKQLVKSLHKAGIEVILDVVFNHTAEGGETGQTFEFRGLDNSIYYMINPDTGEYLNYSGCGNTLNCNHPVLRDLVVQALHYWVTEMHVDGFRFDLASILGRGQNGAVLASPPLIEELALDPLLANTKLIAEAWDAAGLYQVGSFPSWGRWAEWNGRYRDDIRRFLKGDPGMVPALATRLKGSPDLYTGNSREPWHSINFVTCHDGFTLADLVSYDEKHNEANGEWNRDGSNDNFSWNCGAEGATDDAEVKALRARQIRNAATFIVVSHGVPMLLAGDELGRTQRGNNNAYCQDNDVSWVDWGLEEKNADLLRFFRILISIRKRYKLMRHGTFSPDPVGGDVRIEWHGVHLHQPDWSYESRSIAAHAHGMADGEQKHLYFVANAHWEPHTYELPVVAGWVWCRSIDTSRPSPDDINEPGHEFLLTNQQDVTVGPRSVVLLAGRDESSTIS
jgi:isoamylase